MGAATAELAHRNLTRSFASNGDEPRVVLLEDDFEHFVGRGFGAMRGGLASNRIAALVAFDAIVDAASMLDDEARRAILIREGELLVTQAREHLVGPELHLVEARYQRFLQKMER